MSAQNIGLWLFSALFAVAAAVEPPKYTLTSSTTRALHWHYKDFKKQHTNTTFDLRYAYNIEAFRPNGTIFFVPGDQRALSNDSFKRIQFLWDVAPQLNAAIVVAEQRYYGSSQPFPLDKVLSLPGGVWTWQQLAYLDSYSIVYDYVGLLYQFRRDVLGGVPVGQTIAVGVGYTGLYAYWLAGLSDISQVFAEMWQDYRISG